MRNGGPHSAAFCFKTMISGVMVRLVQIGTILKGFVTLCHHFPFQV